MKKNLVPCLVLVSLTVGYGLMVMAGAPQLPERVAIHFGALGRANGWTGRDQAAMFFEALTVVPVIFLVLATAMHVLPAGLFNLPHRDYWLAPERREETVATVSRQLIWMACLMTLFLAGIFWLTVIANRLAPPRLPMDWFVLLLIAFLGSTAVWTILLIARFSKIPRQEK